MSEEQGTDSRGITNLDADELERLVRAHAGSMLATCNRLLACERSAADAVREAFLSTDMVQGSDTAEALDAAALRAALARLTPHEHNRETSTSVTPINDPLPAGLHDPVAEAVDWTNVSTRVVRTQIRKLPPRHRAVLILRDVECRCPAKIAAAMDIDPAEVTVLLHEARRALRELLVRASNAR